MAKGTEELALLLKERKAALNVARSTTETAEKAMGQPVVEISPLPPPAAPQKPPEDGSTADTSHYSP